MDLTLTEFVLFTLVAAAFLVMLFTLISRTVYARSESRALSQRVICRLCLYAFEDAGHSKTVHCPHCDAISERGRTRRLG
jgi:predicted Zn-ribbon and HTH transcriptional regulator